MLVVGLLAVMLTGGCWLLARILVSQDVVLLRGEGGARWIGPNREFNLRAQHEGTFGVLYRRRFEIGATPETALLTVHALRSASVELDGRVVLPESLDPERRRQERSVYLRPFLAPGRHDLVITVLNVNGPALLLAHCPGLGLKTGEGAEWAASLDGEAWSSVADVDHRRLPAFFADFPSSSSALASNWPLFACTFLVAGGLTLFASSRHGCGGRLAARLRGLEARHLRSALLLAWLMLSANSLLRIPLDFGFDTRGHTAYIRFIAEQGRLPLATDGWEMFQSPLYYLIAALPYHFAALPPADTPNALPRALLLIPLVCGAIQVQLAYLATRRVFPGREDLQALGTLVAGFLPINLYASQHIGNEPLAGVLSAGSLVVALGLLAPAAPAGRRRDWALLGTLVGFAMLTKSTAGLLVPPLIFTLAWKLWREDRDVRQLAASLGLVLVTAFSVCGWYYVRNWIELGSPFLVGTEASRGIHWWQEPGYRTPRDFFAFGAALEQPLYASVWLLERSVCELVERWSLQRADSRPAECQAVERGVLDCRRAARPGSQPRALDRRRPQHAEIADRAAVAVPAHPGRRNALSIPARAPLQRRQGDLHPGIVARLCRARRLGLRAPDPPPSSAKRDRRRTGVRGNGGLSSVLRS
jgi:hypothetical protein